MPVRVPTPSLVLSLCEVRGSRSGRSLPLLSGPPAPSGGHVPAAVERYDELPTGGQFLLHRGIQRRLRVTGIRLTAERTPEIQWSDVRAVVGA